MRELHLASLLFNEIDAGTVGGSEVSEVQTEATESQETTETEVSAESNDQQTGEQQEKQVENPTNKRIRELVSQRNDYKTKYEELLNEKESKKTQFDPKDDIYQHPLLKGLEVNEDDGTVELDGTYVSPKFALRVLTAEAKALEGESRIDQSEKAQQQAELNERNRAIFNVIMEDLQGERKSVFSAIADDTTIDMNGQKVKASDVIDDAYAVLVQRFNPKGFDASAEEMQSAIDQAKSVMRYISGIGATSQLASNQAYKEQHNVKPGGQAGQIAPKDFDQLKGKDREAVIAEAVRRTEEQSRR
jgi:hypothetical protein